MVMLSQLLRSEIVDRNGGRAWLDDLALAVLDDDYPPVTAIYFVSDGGRRYLNWENVSGIERGKVLIDDLGAAEESPDEPPKGEVLLKEDILDALILDLLSRRTTRANDLQLEEEDGTLRLKGVDASFGAMLRRISRGAYGRVNEKNLYDWQYVEFLRGDPAAVRNGAGYRLRIGRLPAGEIARLADFVPYLHAAELLKLLPDDKAADVLQAMPLERQVQVIEELEEEEASQLLMRMSPDLATDLVGRLPIRMMKRWLSMIPKENSDRIVELLRYPETAVGGVMINNMIYFTFDTKVAEAREKIAELIERTDFTSLTFVVDNLQDQKLLGSVMLRDLLAAEDERRLEDLMDPYLAALDPFEPAREAAYRLVGGQLAAMPVVEPEGRLIGAMTINAAIAQLLPSSSGFGNLRVFS
jgi:magnesium transporter